MMLLESVLEREMEVGGTLEITLIVLTNCTPRYYQRGGILGRFLPRQQSWQHWHQDGRRLTQGAGPWQPRCVTTPVGYGSGCGRHTPPAAAAGTPCRHKTSSVTRIVNNQYDLRASPAKTGSQKRACIGWVQQVAFRVYAHNIICYLKS